MSRYYRSHDPRLLQHEITSDTFYKQITTGYPCRKKGNLHFRFNIIPDGSVIAIGIIQLGTFLASTILTEMRYNTTVDKIDTIMIPEDAPIMVRIPLYLFNTEYLVPLSIEVCIKCEESVFEIKCGKIVVYRASFKVIPDDRWWPNRGITHLELGVFLRHPTTHFSLSSVDLGMGAHALHLLFLRALVLSARAVHDVDDPYSHTSSGRHVFETLCSAAPFWLHMAVFKLLRSF